MGWDPLNVDKNQEPVTPISSTSQGEGIHIEKHEGADGSLQAPRGISPSGEALHVEPLSVSVHKGIDQLEKAENEVEVVMTNAERSADADPALMHELVKQNGPHWVDMLTSKAEAAQKFNQFFSSLVFPISYPLEQLSVFVAKPLGDITRVYDYNEIGGEISTSLGYASLSVNLPTNLGKGGILIFRTAIYKEIAHQLKLMKEEYKTTPSPELKEKIDTVQLWLKKEKSAMQEQSIWVVLGLARAVPQLTRIGIRISTAAGAGLGAATAGVGFGLTTITGGLGVLSRALQLRTAFKEEGMQKTWQKTYKEKERVADHTSPEKMHESSVQIEALLAKRKDTFEKKSAKMAPELDKLYKNIQSSSMTFEEALELMKEKGLTIPDQIQDKTQLAHFLNDAAERRQLLEQAVSHQDTLSILARNGLKSQSLKKLKLQHVYAKFKVHSASLALFLSILSLTVTTVLTVLILAGAITVPPLGLAMVALGFTVAGIGLVIAGALYFYTSKPNLSHAWLKGVNMRLAFYSIPTAFRSFQLQLDQIKRLRNAFKAHDLSVQMYEVKNLLKNKKSIDLARLPKKLRPLALKYKEDRLTAEETESLQKLLDQSAEKLNQQIELNKKDALKLDEKLRKAEKKLETWNKRKAPLEAKLVKAGLKDFLRAASLKKDSKGQKIQLSKIIVEGILNNPELIDPETVEILKDKLGIDLAKLQNAPNQEVMKQSLVSLLDAFFAKGHDDIVSLISNQQLKQAAQSA